MSELQIALTKENIQKMNKDMKYLEYSIGALPYSDETKAFVYHYAIHAAKSCVWHKYCYYGISALVIILPVISSAVDIVKGDFSGGVLDWIPLVCNSLITIMGGLLALIRFHEKWTRYRNYLEKLINTIAVQPKVEAGTAEEKEKKFIEAIWRINDNHQIEWNTERQKEND
jgi:hypothetical protein